MLPIPPTNRLSPKNQVTLPREAAILAGSPSQVRALCQAMPGKSEPARTSPVVVLMTEAGLRLRERRIIEDPGLSHEEKLVRVQELNAGAALLAIDDQRRVVLPAPFVDYLGLDRDILFVCTGDLIFAWNPDEFRRWHEAAPAPGSPALSRFILV